jgi:hypothetical protein
MVQILATRYYIRKVLIAKWIEPLRMSRPVPTEPDEHFGSTFRLLSIIKQWKGQRTDGAIFQKSD